VNAPSWKGLFEPTPHNNKFRPVTYATFALNWALGKDHPFGYHLFNILLNSAAVLLLYLVLTELLETKPRGTTIAWATALLFAVHPIHTEAVASVSGRSELLATALLLSAWYLHLQDLPFFSLLCFVLAMLSKESAVAFLPLAVAGDVVRSRWKNPVRYLLITGTTFLYLAVLWVVQGNRFGERQVSLLDNPLAYLSPVQRILNALPIAWKYIGLQLFPAALSCDYSYNAIVLDLRWWHTAPAAVATALVVALWIYSLWTERTEWFLAGAIYLAGFAITANILLPTGTIMGERLAYLPSAGFCLFVILLGDRLLNRQQKVAGLVLGLAMAVLAARGVTRNRDWRDNFSLFSADVQTVPGSAKLHAVLGGQYMFRNQWEPARDEFETALRIYPNYPEVLSLSGVAESRMGHDQVALYKLQKALSMTEKGSMSYTTGAVNLAMHLAKIGRSDEGLALLSEVITLSPQSPFAWSSRAVVHYGRGEMALARADAQTALRLDPKNVQAQTILKSINNLSPSLPPGQQP